VELAGGRAVICIIDSEVVVLELDWEVVFALKREPAVNESVIGRSLVEEIPARLGVRVLIDTEGMDVDVAMPPGGYGHQLKLLVLVGISIGFSWRPK
jgi:hypothetical protein